MTTLDDLKQAIEASQPTVHRCHIHGKKHQRLRAEAWRTAFEWATSDPEFMEVGEYEKGMALIREHLK